MKKYLLTLAIISFMLVHESSAQRSLLSLNYAVTVPTANTSNYIDETSGRGFVMEYQRFINENWAIGGEIGHTTLYKKEGNKVYNEGSAALSGIQYRYQYNWPILVTANYFVVTGEAIRPYFGLGMGTVAHDRRIDMGIFTSEEVYWQFALRPEAGILYQVSPGMAFRFGAKYYQAFESGGLDGQSNLGLNLGVVFSN